MSNVAYTEQDQRMAYIKFFIQKMGLEKNDIKIEIPVFSRSIDLVILEKQKQELTAIEFKLLDWKKAIEQVLGIKISFDYSFICVMEPKTVKTKEEIISNCKEKGIGLIFSTYIDGRFEFSCKVEPQKKHEVWIFNREQILNFLDNGDEINEKLYFELRRKNIINNNF